MFDYETYRDIRRKYFGETDQEIRLNYKSYKRYKKAKMYVTAICNKTNTPVFDLCIPCTAPCEAKKAKACKQKEEENSMTTQNTERTYLNNRLNEIRYDKRDTIATQFRIYKDNTPKNYKELIDAIKNGEYVLDEKRTKAIDARAEEIDGAFFHPFDGIKWTRAGGPDHDGYNAAEKSLNKAYIAAKDIINTQDATAGLKAMQEFEAWIPA